MLKTFCDHCGKEITNPNDQVNCDIHAYGVSGVKPEEFNFHVSCFLTLRAYNMPKKEPTAVEAVMNMPINERILTGIGLPPIEKGCE